MAPFFPPSLPPVFRLPYLTVFVLGTVGAPWSSYKKSQELIVWRDQFCLQLS